jgi:hypothetical protein
MTGVKGPSIRWEDFQRVAPNGTWVYEPRRAAPAPIEGILLIPNVDDVKKMHVQGHTLLIVQLIDLIEPVGVEARWLEFGIGEKRVSFRELCIQAQERRLNEVRCMDTVDQHPLQWMTHKDELNLSIEQIGAMLFETASWIEAAGNKGYSDNDLMKAVPSLRVRLLDNAYRMAWQDILFFGDGERKRDFDGWGVHKRTPAHWTMTWLERFGLDHPKAQTLTDEIWDEAMAEHARRAVTRPHETYVEVDLEQEPTCSIAHKAAAMWLLSRWAQRQGWTRAPREVWRIQARLFGEAYEVFVNELEYRQDRQPQPRRSKKKTQAVRDDWATASSYFAPGIGFDAYRFYSQAYVQACFESDVTPDVSVDFDALPRGIQTEEVQEIKTHDS